MIQNKVDYTLVYDRQHKKQAEVGREERHRPSYDDHDSRDGEPVRTDRRSGKKESSLNRLSRFMVEDFN